MTFSIRTKLTFWYTSLLAISLILFGLSFFYALSKIYMNRIDREISSVAGLMVHTIVEPPGRLRLPRNFDIILERFFGLRIRGNYIQVLTPDGRVAGRSSTLEGLELPLTERAYRRALDGKRTYETVRTFGVYPVRILTLPVVVKKTGLVAIIQVATSLEGMEEIFHYMIYFFSFGIVLSIIIAGGVGWFLAGKALKPVDEMTRIARRITAERLNQRLPIVKPDDELGRLASTFNEMIARLERSFRQIKQFTADASHELKTPLTVMKGEVEVALKSRADEKELREVLVSILEEIDRMNEVIKGLLTLARTDVEEATIKEPVSLDDIVRERCEQFKKLANTKGLKLNVDIEKDVVVLAEPVRIGQVIYNLVDNAIKYTPRGGSISVTLNKRGRCAILRVSDTGIGIPEEELPYIFDRFYRVDKARTGGSGVGLGLSICKEIINTYGGKIEVESKPNEGTTFTVYLPLAEEHTMKEVD